MKIVFTEQERATALKAKTVAKDVTVRTTAATAASAIVVGRGLWATMKAASEAAKVAYAEAQKDTAAKTPKA